MIQKEYVQFLAEYGKPIAGPGQRPVIAGQRAWVMTVACAKCGARAGELCVRWRRYDRTPHHDNHPMKPMYKSYHMPRHYRAIEQWRLQSVDLEKLLKDYLHNDDVCDRGSCNNG